MDLWRVYDSVDDASKERCMGAFTGGDLGRVYRELCPDAKREKYVDLLGANTHVTECYLDLTTIPKAIPERGDSTAKHFKTAFEVQDRAVTWTWCQTGYIPSVQSLSCVLGFFFPPTFKCEENVCPSPNMENVSNAYAGSACEEGDGVAEGGWCTPRCASGYKAVWTQPSASQSKCDAAKKTSRVALCCHAGTMSPPTFACEPFIDTAKTLKDGMTRLLANTLTEAVPQGVRVVAVKHAKNQTAKNLWVLDVSGRSKEKSIATDFMGLDMRYSIEADLTSPLPESSKPVPSRGRVILDTHVTGDVHVLWKEQSVQCLPVGLKCKISLRKYFEGEIVEPNDPLDESLMSDPPRGWSPFGWEWLTKWQDECSTELCSRLEQKAKGTNLRPIDGSLYEDYKCQGIDPLFILIGPLVVGPVLTLIFIIFSRTILLDKWKNKYKMSKRPDATSMSHQLDKAAQFHEESRQAEDDLKRLQSRENVEAKAEAAEGAATEDAAPAAAAAEGADQQPPATSEEALAAT